GLPPRASCGRRRSRPRDGIRTRRRNEAMNVLLVTTGQQRADTVGAYGSRLEATPNLDRLAATGVRFDACRTQNPYCQPSRATILTGRYGSRHGVYSNGVDFPQEDVGTTLSALPLPRRAGGRHAAARRDDDRGSAAALTRARDVGLGARRGGSPDHLRRRPHRRLPPARRSHAPVVLLDLVHRPASPDGPARAL